MSGTEAGELLTGRGEGRCAKHGEATSRGFQRHEQGTAAPFTPDNHLVMQGSNTPSPSQWLQSLCNYRNLNHYS